jgi:hypothetical protein
LLLWVRWQLFRNSLKKPGRNREFVFSVLGVVLMGFVIAGTSIGFFFGTFISVQAGRIWVVNLLLWTVLLIWQLAPILFEGFSPGLNFREIARYPISFSLYYTLSALYGLLDPAAIASLLWLAAIWLGLTLGNPSWAILGGLALLLFAGLNLLCNRIVIGFFERFQSTRKGRERLAVIFLIVMTLPQLIQVLSYNWSRVTSFLPLRSLQKVVIPVNTISPAGLVVESLSWHGFSALAPMILLLLYVLLAGLLLSYQLGRIYQGEIYAEGISAQHELKVQPGWAVPGFDPTVVAIVEKELRYLRQNSRVVVQLIYPIVIVALFATARGPVAKAFGAGRVGPLGLIASVLVLNVPNLGYNIFGMDQEGFGRWLLSPLPLEKVILAKNLAHGALFLMIYLLVAAVSLAITSTSFLSLASMTIGFVVLLLVQLTAGNIISAHWPRKVDLTRMSSRMASSAAGFASLLVTLPSSIAVALVILLASYLHLPWLPLVAGLVLLAVVLALYSHFLRRAAQYLYDHLEEIEKALSG